MSRTLGLWHGQASDDDRGKATAAAPRLGNEAARQTIGPGRDLSRGPPNLVQHRPWQAKVSHPLQLALRLAVRPHVMGADEPTTVARDSAPRGRIA